MKFIMKIAFVAAFAVVAGYNVYKSNSVMDGMSEFALANVEALAQSESEGLMYCPYNGYACQVNFTNGTTQIYWGLSPNYHP